MKVSADTTPRRVLYSNDIAVASVFDDNVISIFRYGLEAVDVRIRNLIDSDVFYRVHDHSRPIKRAIDEYLIMTCYSIIEPDVALKRGLQNDKLQNRK